MLQFENENQMHVHLGMQTTKQQRKLIFVCVALATIYTNYKLCSPDKCMLFKNYIVQLHLCNDTTEPGPCHKMYKPLLPL
jgi:hypothetical protein